jgi:hypothetical protein
MPATAALPWTRMGIGLLQGGLLVALAETAEHHVWPATNGLVFAPLFTIAIFIPALVLAGLGNLSRRTLLVWAIIAGVFCAGLAIYDVYRDPVTPGFVQLVLPRSDLISRIYPTSTLWVSLAAILFIMHSLIVSAETDGRWVASYPSLFDVSWKQGVQLFLIIAFIAVLWGLLFLGAELFRLIRINFVAELIRRTVFWIPVTALAFSYAMHVTDVRANIVRGARTLKLLLLSWLLPVMVIITVGFIAALPFTGLEPLWATRRAASILLIAAAVLIFLVNAAYQDGRAESRPVAALRYAGVIAAIVLLPLVALASYAVLLRVRQYGWTPERIGAVACIVVAACYGVGYVVAAARSGLNLRELETTNLVTSLVIVSVILLLRSPLADPARISVMDQVGRLETGRIPPEKFDFAFLRFRSGRFGMEALHQLAVAASGPDADVVKERAGDALLAKSAFDIKPGAPRLTPQLLADNITVIRPSGASLPESFLAQDWKAFPRRWQLPRCLIAAAKCDAVMVDLDGDGQPEILLFNQPGTAAAFKAEADNSWKLLGTISNTFCRGVQEALRAGQFELVEPGLKDIEVAGQRLHVTMGCADASRQ